MSEYATPVYVETLDLRPVRSPNWVRYIQTSKREVMIFWDRPKSMNLLGYNIYLRKNKKLVKLNKALIHKNQRKFRYNSKLLLGYSKIFFEVYGVNSRNEQAKKGTTLRYTKKAKPLTNAGNIRMNYTLKGVIFFWPKEVFESDIIYELYKKRSGEKHYLRVGKVNGSVHSILDKERGFGYFQYFLKKIQKMSGDTRTSKIFRIRLRKRSIKIKK